MLYRIGYNQLNNEITSNAEQITSVQISVARDYVNNAELDARLERFERRIQKSLDRIEQQNMELMTAIQAVHRGKHDGD